MSRNKQDLAQALQKASGKAEITDTVESTAVQKVKKQTLPTPPSRIGKRAITGFFDPAAAKQFKRLALEKDMTVQLLLAEAINDVFVKYKQSPIA